jgi:hypothetical protein
VLGHLRLLPGRCSSWPRGIASSSSSRVAIFEFSALGLVLGTTVDYDQRRRGTTTTAHLLLHPAAKGINLSSVNESNSLFNQHHLVKTVISPFSPGRVGMTRPDQIGPDRPDRLHKTIQDYRDRTDQIDRPQPAAAMGGKRFVPCCVMLCNPHASCWLLAVLPLVVMAPMVGRKGLSWRRPCPWTPGGGPPGIARRAQVCVLIDLQ